MNEKNNDFINPSSLGSVNTINDDKIAEAISKIEEAIREQNNLLSSLLNKNEKIIEDTVNKELDTKEEQKEDIQVSENTNPVVTPDVSIPVEAPEVTPVVEETKTEEIPSPVAETPVVENITPTVPVTEEVKAEEIPSPVVENPVSPLENTNEVKEEPELNPVLEQTMELPQESLEEAKTTENTDQIIGMDELLNSISSEEVSQAPENVNTEITPDVSIPTQVQENKTEQSVVPEAPVVEPVKTPEPVTPVVENIAPEVAKTENPAPVVTPSVPVTEEVKPEEIVEPAENITPVVNNESNIEILTVAILPDVVNAGGKQRALEADNAKINKQEKNEKTLVNTLSM